VETIPQKPMETIEGNEGEGETMDAQEMEEEDANVVLMPMVNKKTFCKWAVPD